MILRVSGALCNRVVRAGIALLVVATVGGWSGLTAHALSSARNAGEFGINSHLTWHAPLLVNRELDRLQSAGVVSTRVDVYWNQLEPQRGVWDVVGLGHLDAVVAAMEAHGITGVFTLLGVPRWARYGYGTLMTPPLNPNDFGVAAGYLAARYAHHPHMVWEIWNEPNDTHFWNAPRSAWYYTLMLRSAYTHIKAAAPSATVLGGAIVFNDQLYLEMMYAAGAKGYFDALSLHPYTGAFPPASTFWPHYSFPLTVQGMEAVMAKYGEPNKPIWITEMGWSTRLVSDAVRATYLRQAVGLVRGWPYVKGFYASELEQSDSALYGLIKTDGTPTLSWQAYTDAINSGSGHA